MRQKIFVFGLVWLVGLVLALLAPRVFAAAPTMLWHTSWGGGLYSADPEAVGLKMCQGRFPHMSDVRQVLLGGQDVGTATVLSYQCSNPGPWGDNWYGAQEIHKVSRCADGTEPNTALPLAQQCAEPTPTCTTGEETEITMPAGVMRHQGDVSGSAPFPDRVGRCLATVESVVRCYTNAAIAYPKPSFCVYQVKLTGGIASVGEAGAPPLDPANQPSDKAPNNLPPSAAGEGKTCPKGTVNIGTGVTGEAMCAGSGTTPDVKSPPVTKNPPVTATNPDGSTTKTETTTKQNSDGSTTTTTKTTTTGTDGKETTSEAKTTGAATGGMSGKEDATGEEKKDDFCKQHPELNICKNSQVTGQCAAITCTGDAIQCSIAKQVADQNCREKEAEKAVKESAAYALGDAAMKGADPANATLPTKANGAQYALPASLDSSGWLGGGGGCFPDKTFAMFGQTMTVSFAQACAPLVVFRYALMIIALLISFRMLSGTILRS